VIVVDNASTDGSAQMVANHFSQVKLIRNRRNNFYTKANNQALKLAQGKYFLILNSDTFLKSNAFKKLVDYLNHHSKVGAVEPCQVYEDGRIALTGSRHNRIWSDLVALTGLHRLIKLKTLPQDRKLTYPAEVISDGAMLIRTGLFKKLGGYDENLKLYYTENDLCRRIQAQKFSTVHLGSAQLSHTVSASTDKAGWKTISQIYSRDALTYYLKYGSKISAWLLFLALKFNNLLILLKQNLLLILIILLATWLRFFRLPELMTFIGDQGKDYLTARDMVLSGRPALVGIASSVPWLRQGPFFIWILALVFKLTGFNPVHPAILTAVLGVLTVYLTYKFSRSRLAAFILAASPLAVIHSRLAYHISPIPLFSILYLFALRNFSVGWTFFLAGILLQFELTTLPLTILALIRFKKFSFYWLIPFIPKIIYDLSHGFTQTLGFGAWAGYRLVNFHKYGNALPAIFEYWQKFTSWDQPWVAAVLGLLALAVIYRHKLLFYFLLINLIGFFLHGAPSEAYFPVLFPLWAIMLSLIKPKIIKALIIFVCFYNIYFLSSHNFVTYGPTLKEQISSPQSGANYDYLSWWLNYE
jgi:GT2 family glycosyltransferase